MRHLRLLAFPLALLAAACGSSSSSSTTRATTSTSASRSSNAASVSTRNLSGLGTVLVNGQGRTVYAFLPEKGGKLQCTGSCASLWPPVMAGSGGKPAVSGEASASMVSTVTSPTGGSIVTYDSWPLHTYASDSGPGSASGQGIAGKWYVVSPAGTPITKKASSSSSSSSSGGGARPY